MQKSPHISEAIKEAFKNIDKTGTPGITRDDISSAWQKAAGAKAVKHSNPARLKEKTLIVNVDSTAWIYQLRLKEQGLLKKINRLLKKTQVERIRFRAGEL